MKNETEKEATEERGTSALTRLLGGRPRIDTPNNVEILIHCHCCAEPHPRATAPAVKECLDWFLEEGVIERDTESEKNIFRTTALGEAWMKAICNTPMPRQVFVDEKGEML